MADAIAQGDAALREFLQSQSNEEAASGNQPTDATQETTQTGQPFEYEGRKYDPKELVSTYERRRSYDKDYTTKNQKLAEEKRAFEAERMKFYDAQKAASEAFNPNANKRVPDYANPDSPNYDPYRAEAYELKQEIQDLKKFKDDADTWRKTVEGQAREYNTRESLKSVLSTELSKPEYSELPKSVTQEISNDYWSILRTSREQGTNIEPAQALKLAYDYNMKAMEDYLRFRAQKATAKRMPHFETGGRASTPPRKSQEYKVEKAGDAIKQAAAAARREFLR